MTRRIPGFIWPRFLRATGFETPSHTVILSRCKFSKEYSEGSVLSKYSAATSSSLLRRSGRQAFYTRITRTLRALLVPAQWRSSLVQPSVHQAHPTPAIPCNHLNWANPQKTDLANPVCRSIHLSIQRVATLPSWTMPLPKGTLFAVTFNRRPIWLASFALVVAVIAGGYPTRAQQT